MKQVMWGTALLSVCATSLVFAQAETPRIDQRQANQEKRIDQGIASGQLNEREATRLNNQQEHVNRYNCTPLSGGQRRRGFGLKIECTTTATPSKRLCSA